MQSISVYLLAALASMCLFGRGGQPASGGSDLPPPVISEPKEDTAVTADTKIADVIADPIFWDYGRLLFLVQSAYYSHIDPDATVEIVNYLKEQAEAGETVFYDIYTDAEKAADPAKENTGLFFFRGNEGLPLPSAMPAVPSPMWRPCTTAFLTRWSCPKWATTLCPDLPAWATVSAWEPGRRRRAGSTTRRCGHHQRGAEGQDRLGLPQAQRPLCPHGPHLHLYRPKSPDDFRGGDMPMILYSFLEQYDFSGKTIIPFNTHGGSGFSGTIGTIRSLEPQAEVLDGLYNGQRSAAVLLCV